MIRFKKARMALVLLGATVALGASAAPALAGDDVVKVRDACDPATFNAAVGPGTCVRDGNRGGRVTFDEFVEEGADDGGHGAWSFSERKLRVDEGDRVVARFDRGGEFHTFSPVAAYGPGCVPPVNAIIGLLGEPVANCATFETGPNPLEFVAPGLPDAVTPPLAEGTHRFMCLIHPWMKTTVEVR